MQQETDRRCPRCGVALPDDAYYEPLQAPPGRDPAYRVRHKRDDGTWCVAYAGPEKDEGRAT